MVYSVFLVLASVVLTVAAENIPTTRVTRTARRRTVPLSFPPGNICFDFIGLLPRSMGTSLCLVGERCLFFEQNLLVEDVSE